MGLYINTNQSALNAQRKLTTTSNALGRSFERLSSGLQINDASNQIIQQAGVSILAQANQQPQIALALLG